MMVIIAAAWKQISYNFLFFLAGLQSIPKSMIEAAAIDGASPTRRFWTIVFPLLSPTTFFLLVVNLVYAFFDTFAIIHATTSRRTGGRDLDPCLPRLFHRIRRSGLRVERGAVGRAHGAGHRPDLRAVPVYRTEGAVLMVENRPWLGVLTHATLILGVAFLCFPVWMASRGLHPPGRGAQPVAHPAVVRRPRLGRTYAQLLTEGSPAVGGVDLSTMLLNSFIMAIGITVGKIAISLISAFAIVYFRFPFRMLFFWLIFITLMLPVEVRILPTYDVVASLGMLNSYSGLIIPLIASATATFLFRQFFLTIPDELVEAARIDRAGPIRFFWDILLPLSKTNIAALFIILFIYGWNQYLWPFLITTDQDLYTIVMGIQRMVNVGEGLPIWHLTMGTAILAMVPPVLVVLAMQRLFVKGLVESEK